MLGCNKGWTATHTYHAKLAFLAQLVYVIPFLGCDLWTALYNTQVNMYPSQPDQMLYVFLFSLKNQNEYNDQINISIWDNRVNWQ